MVGGVIGMLHANTLTHVHKRTHTYSKFTPMVCSAAVFIIVAFDQVPLLQQSATFSTTLVH